MSEADINEEPKRELVEPSFDDKMDVEVEGEALPLEQGKSGSQMASADHVTGELTGKLDVKDANVELTFADEVGDGTVSGNLRKGNEDHDVTYKVGDAVENRGLPSTKEDIGNDLGSVQAENGGQILDTKKNEVHSCENQIGDTLVNENVSGDAQVKNGEQIMVVEEKEVQFEKNQTRDISVKSEENQIGDVSVKSKKNQMTEIPSKVKEKQSQHTSVNHKENPNGDTSLKPQENQMGNTIVKSEAKQNGEASVMSEENQIRDVSMNPTENQIADASVKLEDKHFEDALPKRKEIHFDHALIKKDTVNGEGSKQPLVLHSQKAEGDDSGTEEEQAAFMKELQNFYKERSMDFKPPKFYGEGLNCLKLWRAVTRLGGYEQVTSCKLWRQVGESFKPPKTCTTVSWTFRCFYEKALLEYEKHKIQTGELEVSVSALPETVSVENQVGICQASGSGRARRDAAARAMQGWHSQRLLGNGEVGDPIIKDKSSISFVKRDKQLKSVGIFKRKKSSSFERPVKAARLSTEKPQMDNMVVDVGPPAEWVKINVRRTKDCFEIYALVPGLLREEVHVQSDPAGRLVISGEPEQLDNPWGVTPFKKIVTLPSRIDPHQTSAIVTLHGQLFVRAPFEQAGLS